MNRLTMIKFINNSWHTQVTEFLDQHPDFKKLIPIVALDEYPECALLSSVAKKNKCNSDIDYSLVSFDPLNFNPLVYQFKYFDTVSNYYRVDGKDYIIEIKPKN